MAALLALIVRAYQLLLRPLLPPACRFEPSCSSYAIEALHRHGALRGAMLAAWRVMRCNPWGPCGYDPVPRGRAPHAATCRHIHTGTVGHHAPAPAPSDFRAR